MSVAVGGFFEFFADVGNKVLGALGGLEGFVLRGGRAPFFYFMNFVGIKVLRALGGMFVYLPLQLVEFWLRATW